MDWKSSGKGDRFIFRTGKGDMEKGTWKRVEKGTDLFLVNFDRY